MSEETVAAAISGAVLTCRVLTTGAWIVIGVLWGVRFLA